MNPEPTKEQHLRDRYHDEFYCQVSIVGISDLRLQLMRMYNDLMDDRIDIEDPLEYMCDYLLEYIGDDEVSKLFKMIKFRFCK